MPNNPSFPTTAANLLHQVFIPSIKCRIKNAADDFLVTLQFDDDSTLRIRIKKEDAPAWARQRLGTKPNLDAE